MLDISTVIEKIHYKYCKDAVAGNVQSELHNFRCEKLIDLIREYISAKYIPIEAFAWSDNPNEFKAEAKRMNEAIDLATADELNKILEDVK